MIPRFALKVGWVIARFELNEAEISQNSPSMTRAAGRGSFRVLKERHASKLEFCESVILAATGPLLLDEIQCSLDEVRIRQARWQYDRLDTRAPHAPTNTLGWVVAEVAADHIEPSRGEVDSLVFIA